MLLYWILGIIVHYTSFVLKVLCANGSCRTGRKEFFVMAKNNNPYGDEARRVIEDIYEKGGSIFDAQSYLYHEFGEEYFCSYEYVIRVWRKYWKKRDRIR